ncbi:MAG: hypothetical protein HDR82_08570 [Bacteroides sp.]|nr:hypothetical protein [Bacteroides sp.]
MGKFFNVIIFSLCLLVAACSDNNNEPDEILPIHFGSSDYTVMFGVSHAIPFTDGGGEYVVEVGNQAVLGEVSIDAEAHEVIINPSKTGKSTLTITDVNADRMVTLNIAVEDFYLSFKIDEIEGTNTNWSFQLNGEIRFIRDEENTKPLKVVWHNHMSFREYVVDGHFDIDRSGTNIFTMQISLQPPKDEDAESFEYTMGGDGECMSLFERIFDLDWDGSVASSQFAIARNIKMILIDKSTGCRITCLLQP